MASTEIISRQTATPSFRRDHSAVAPAWHTAVVLAALLGFSLLGALRGNLPGIGASGRIGGYFLVMLLEWSIVAFICYGTGSRVLRLSDLVGGRWARPRDFFRDFGIAIGFIAVCGVGMVNGVGYFLKAVPDRAFLNLMPRTGVEVMLYVMLSLTAGFCEEVIFRGYLNRQLAALTRSAAGGILLQGVLFGASHGYQGWKFMLLITIYGSMFGLLVYWRRSLRPGMIAHALQDSVGGILNFLFGGSLAR
jgi:uncharacterized protein